jgi:hypothetical protein
MCNYSHFAFLTLYSCYKKRTSVAVVVIVSFCLYRCRESKSKSEAFLPCTLALYRVWLLHLWTSYRLYVLVKKKKTTTNKIKQKNKNLGFLEHPTRPKGWL